MSGQAEKDLERIHDYAWNWFAYHAGQRTSMFNYALAAAALLAAGYGAVLDKHPGVAAAIGFVGAFVLFCFVLVDGRNASLVERGEDVLDAIEKTLFDPPAEGSRLRANGLPRGIHVVDKKKYPPGSRYRDFQVGKHGIHLRLIEGVLFLAFVLGAAFALVSPPAQEPDTAGAVRRVAQTLDAVDGALKRIGDKLDRPN